MQDACCVVVFIWYMPSPQGKYWCFTLNNYTVEEEKHVGYLATGEHVTYIIFGRERGENGTPHLQGYLELTKKRRLGFVKKLDGLARAHIELRKGTASEAADYCKKEGDYVEEGEISRGQGHRSDLDEIKRKLDAGASESEIAEQHFGDWCRMRKSFSAYRDLKLPKTCRDVSVYVLYGDPGTGKTRFVYEEYPDVCILSDPTLQWFDGYNGEETVLIDDYRGDANASFMLRLLDRYPLRVPVKGGFKPWAVTTLFITSNMSPPFGHGDIAAPLKRRIKKVMRLTTPLNFDDPEEMSKFRGALYQ